MVSGAMVGRVGSRACPAHIDDEAQLVEIVPPGEERLPTNHLGEYAPHRPHIDGGRVVLVRVRVRARVRVKVEGEG